MRVMQCLDTPRCHQRVAERIGPASGVLRLVLQYTSTTPISHLPSDAAPVIVFRRARVSYPIADDVVFGVQSNGLH